MIRARQVFQIVLVLLLILSVDLTYARDVEVTSSTSEVTVWVAPGEPTQVKFPGKVSGGYMKQNSAVTVDRRESDLVVFGNETLSSTGEVILVRLDDGRSYSLRVLRAEGANVRDAQVTVEDGKEILAKEGEEEDLPHIEQKFDYAPPSRVAGLMREMILAMEFGKASISGYRMSEKHKGETVLADGTIRASIERIFVGPNLWGYVVSAENLLDQSQRLNPGSFRIDGTRAISISNWELAPRPMNVEEQFADKHRTKIYIITKAK